MMKGFIENMPFAKIRPPVPGYPDVEGAVVANIELFFAGQMTAQEALDDAQSKGDKILIDNLPE